MSNPHSHAVSAPADSVIDPVCGMKVPITSKYRSTYQGREYFFCCGNCLAKFAADPARYAALESPPTTGADLKPAPAAAGVEYTCPMHPEVRQKGPGSCPKCGMAL